MFLMVYPQLFKHSVKPRHRACNSPPSEKLLIGNIPNNSPRLLFHSSNKIFRSHILSQRYPKMRKRNPTSFTINREIHHLHFERRPRLTKRPEPGNHHLLHKIMTFGILASQSKGLVKPLCEG
jgi:hypothetical protein